METKGCWARTVLLLVMLTAAGCAKGTAPEAPPQQVSSGADQAAAENEPSPVDSVQAEIARLEALVARQPTADNWNELSYAQIMARRWDAAAHAGSEALKLKRDHPYALYNTGLALVRMQQAMQALPHLKLSAALQPDRYEPIMVLAQAYEQLGHFLLASHYAQQAVTLAQGDPEALSTERSVAGMLRVKPPIDLPSACTERVPDGKFFVCLYRESAPELEVSGLASAYTGARFTLWYGTEGQATRPIPVGYTDPAELVTVSLPGGATGYWLPGGYVGAGVAGTREWRLFIREGSDLRQVLFLGGDQYEGGAVSDFMRAPGVPMLKGDQIITDHRDDVTGSRTLRTTRKLSVVEGTVTVVAAEEIVSGLLTQVTPKVEVESTYSYKWAYGMAEGAELTLNGQPAKLSDLTLGTRVTITVRNGLIVELDASGR